jgi:hypothetical protein
MTYCFGKLPKKSDYRTLLFKNFSEALPLPPPSFSNLDRVYAALKVSDPTKLFPMDGNDTKGDCTFAGRAHAITTFQGIIGKLNVMPSAAVVAAYLKWTKGQDIGANELDLLTDWRKHSFGADKILGFASVQSHNHVHVQQAIQLFGGCYLGFQCQENVIADFEAHRPWTPGKLTNEGHAVWAVDYDPDTVTVLTWGGVQKGTWPWWDECVDESYAILPPEAKNPSFAPGFDIAKFEAALSAVTN